MRCTSHKLFDTLQINLILVSAFVPTILATLLGRSIVFLFSGATGLQLKEAQSINKSLSALGDVINALTSGNKHIPYRNHPLTMLMSDSMGGNAKTLMFVCCSPASFNCSETTNSLDFAKRCKNVTNAVKGSIGGGGGRSSETSQVKALKAELLRMKKNGSTGVQRKTAGPRRPGPAARK